MINIPGFREKFYYKISKNSDSVIDGILKNNFELGLSLYSNEDEVCID